MEKTRQKEIDSRAQSVLVGALPRWSVNSQKDEDYAKDYLIELTDTNRKLTGVSFFAQLKGTEQPKFSPDGKQLRFRLETKHAKYYIDKMKNLPVFLILVDVNTSRAWWVFLQPLLDCESRWRRQNTFTIYLPVLNELADTSKLEAEVANANEWMRRRHPVAIRDAVSAERERVIAIDPRFDLEIIAKGGAVDRRIFVRESVRLKFELSLPRNDPSDRLEMLNRGEMIWVQPGEASVSGSPLFDFFETHGGGVQFLLKRTASVTLVERDRNGNELGRLDEIPGYLTGGFKQITFEGELENSPLTIKCGPFAAGQKGSINLKCDMKRWNGQSLLYLAYFDRIYSFFSRMSDATTTEVVVSIDGNQIWLGPAVLKSDDYFVRYLPRILLIVSKARTVANFCQANPMWSVDVLEQDTEAEIEELYKLVTSGEYERNIPGGVLNMSISKATANIDLLATMDAPTHFRIENQIGARQLLGQEIELGPIAYDFSKMTVTWRESETLDDDGGGLIEVAARGSYDAKLVVRRLDA